MYTMNNVPCDISDVTYHMCQVTSNITILETVLILESSTSVLDYYRPIVLQYYHKEEGLKYYSTTDTQFYSISIQQYFCITVLQ